MRSPLQGKLIASIRWLIARVYGASVPDQLINPFMKDEDVSCASKIQIVINPYYFFSGTSASQAASDVLAHKWRVVLRRRGKNVPRFGVSIAESRRRATCAAALWTRRARSARQRESDGDDAENRSATQSGTFY